jgi:outer membrane protein assembly factor BamB
MKPLHLIPAAVFAAAVSLVLFWWLTYNPAEDLFVYVPGMDGRPARLAAEAGAVVIGAHMQRYAGRPSSLPGEWPRFRGPGFDNIYREAVPLSHEWAEEGPPVLWTVELGEGHAAPAVLNGMVYVLDYDETTRSDALRAFSLETGEEIWRRWYQVSIKRNHGRSRTIPAVTDRYVVTIGPACHVMAVDARSGEYLWGIDLAREYETKVPLWYTGQCPLIDGEVAVIAPGGRALLIGVDLASGNVIWETPNNRGWNMSHSSVMPMVLGGKKMYVYFAVGGLVGVSAEGDDVGQILWETDAWTNSVVAPSPVVFEDGRIYVTAGYGGGGAMFQVHERNGVFSVELLYAHDPKGGLASEQQTPMLYDGHLFGILPKDAGPNRNQFVCYDPDGNLVWASGKTNQFGLGPFILADGKFYILNDVGVLTIIEASTEGYNELSQVTVMDGVDSWGPMAIAGGLMLLRDSTRMICIDIRANQGVGSS